MKRENSPGSEVSPSVENNKNTSGAEDVPAGDTGRGASSSHGPRMRSLAEFSVEADLPLSKRLTPLQKKKKPGRPTRLGRKGKSSEETVGDEEWVDEPDVCAFCDDGVEGSDRLLWYCFTFSRSWFFFGFLLS